MSTSDRFEEGPWRRAAVFYLRAQAALTVAWWSGLLASPAFRRLFVADGAPDETLLAFCLADLGGVVIGSTMAARWMARRDRRARAALWFAAGAVDYAALYCLVLSVMTESAWWAVVTMVPAGIITTCIARCETRT